MDSGAESDDSSSKTSVSCSSSSCSSSSPSPRQPPTAAGNLKRFLDSTTPTVPAQYFPNVPFFLGFCFSGGFGLVFLWFDSGFVGVNVQTSVRQWRSCEGRIRALTLTLEIFGSRSASGVLMVLGCLWC